MQLAGQATSRVGQHRGVAGGLIAAIVALLIVATVGLAGPALHFATTAPADISRPVAQDGTSQVTGPGSRSVVAPAGQSGLRQAPSGRADRLWMTRDGKEGFKQAETGSFSRRMIAR